MSRVSQLKFGRWLEDSRTRCANMSRHGYRGAGLTSGEADSLRHRFPQPKAPPMLNSVWMATKTLVFIGELGGFLLRPPHKTIQLQECSGIDAIDDR